MPAIEKELDTRSADFPEEDVLLLVTESAANSHVEADKLKDIEKMMNRAENVKSKQAFAKCVSVDACTDPSVKISWWQATATSRSFAVSNFTLRRPRPRGPEAFSFTRLSLATSNFKMARG